MYQGREFYNKLMQEWLENNYILMCSRYNGGESVITKRFIKTLKSKFYKKMTANDLNKLVALTIILIIILLIKRPFNADYSASCENFELNPKAPKFKVNDRVKIKKYKNTFSKDYTEHWSR